jgi:hypothetical protein
MNRLKREGILLLLILLAILCLAVLPYSKASYPFTTDISISVEPQKMIYEQGTNLSIVFNFTAWYNYDITYFASYSLDGGNSSILEYQISASDSWEPYVAEMHGSVTLPLLGEGNHNITVLVQASYSQGSKMFYTNSSNSVTFAVNTPSSPTPSPTSNKTLISEILNPTYLIAIAVVIVIAAVASVLLVFFKKRKPKRD